MEALAIHTGAPTVYWEENISFISVVKATGVNPRVKQINIPIDVFHGHAFDRNWYIE